MARLVHLSLAGEQMKTALTLSHHLQRVDTAVSDSTSESHLTCKQHKESQTPGEMFKKKRTFPPSGFLEGALECFEVQTSGYLSDIMSRTIKMAGIPRGDTKGLVCFFLFRQLTCSGTQAWDETCRHSWNSSWWTFPQQFLSLTHWSLSRRQSPPFLFCCRTGK